ncbi:hypothetical protein B0H11DRAFT_688298 [Mycena galericulata]|nr:hypothetical protein B0H11DRAFT_688298 [Mycena galericulata]
MIAMGDIDLMKEIRLHEDSGVASRKRAGQVRRIYSARVNGGKANMTVSLYEGKNAEKQWREDIEEYISFRHPNFLQLYGISSSHGIHAAVFHDDLIPVKHIMEMYSSPVATVYLWGYLDEEFRNARDYFYTISCVVQDVQRGYDFQAVASALTSQIASPTFALLSFIAHRNLCLGASSHSNCFNPTRFPR